MTRERNDGWSVWVAAGLSVLGLAATAALVYRHYQVERRRAFEEHDPRARQVRALIEEAETLLSMGRKGLKST